MGATLEELLEATKDYVISPDEAEEQRRSFAYGQLMLHNPAMSPEEGRALIARAAWKIDRERLTTARGWARRWKALAKSRLSGREVRAIEAAFPDYVATEWVVGVDYFGEAVEEEIPLAERVKQLAETADKAMDSATELDERADEAEKKCAALQKALGEAATHVLDATLLLEELCSPVDVGEAVAEAKRRVAAWRALASAGAASTGAETKEPT